MQDARFPEGSLPSIITAATASGISNFIVNGCWPGDWHRVEKLASQYPGVIIPQFGLHPWWVARRHERDATEKSETSSDWLQALRRILIKHPHAGLGECGLDKGTKGLAAAEWEDQIAALYAQLRLAEELHRPVTLHCVRAFGAIRDALKELSLTVPVVLHAWTGTAEITTALLQIPNVYFSLGVHLTRVAPPKAVAMLGVLSNALDRCLLESDSPDGLLSLSDAWIEAVPALLKLKSELDTKAVEAKQQGGQRGKNNTPISARQTLVLIAIVMGKSEEEIASATTRNAHKVFFFHKALK